MPKSGWPNSKTFFVAEAQRDSKTVDAICRFSYHKEAWNSFLKGRSFPLVGKASFSLDSAAEPGKERCWSRHNVLNLSVLKGRGLS